MRIPVLSVVLLLVVGATPSFAQNASDLDSLDEQLIRHFERAMPGWKHERVEPVMKTENVLIQFWSFSNRKVKIAVIPHKSAAEAREVLQRHARYESNKQQLSDLGDEAYAGGYGSADIAFRKGRLTIYVSTTAEIGEKPEERMLSQSERFELMKSEMRRLSKEFAKHMAAVIDLP